MAKGLIISPSILTKTKVSPESVAAYHIFNSHLCFIGKWRVCEISIVTIRNKSRWSCIYKPITWPLVWEVSSGSGRSGPVRFGVISWQGAGCSTSSRSLLWLQKQCQEVLTQLKEGRLNGVWVRPWLSCPPNSQKLLHHIWLPMRLSHATTVEGHWLLLLVPWHPASGWL